MKKIQNRSIEIMKLDKSYLSLTEEKELRNEILAIDTEFYSIENDCRTGPIAGLHISIATSIIFSSLLIILT